MPYLVIVFLCIISIFFIILWKKEKKKEMLSKSKISDLTHTVISEGEKYALIMYHHDPHDEAQLSWALSKAENISRIDAHNLYFYNIGSKTLSKRRINDIFLKLKEDEYTILNGYLNDKEVSYMFIIRNNEENIIFNTIIEI